MARSCVPEGLVPQPWQTLGVWFCGQRQARDGFGRLSVYLALEPGLGKTVVSALLINETVWNKANPVNPAPTVHYVCPPALVDNVAEEFGRWLVHDAPKPKIVADTKLANNVPARTPGAILFVDEAHRFMNEKTGRSAALFAYARAFSRVIFLSGTPMPNARPRELWPVLREFAPDVFGRDFYAFARRFCGPTENKFWVSTPDGPREKTKLKFDGFSNKREFKARLTQSFMLRIRKDELKDALPPRTEELLTVGDEIPAVVSRLERKVLEHFTAEDVVEGRVAAAAGSKGALHLARYLKLLGEHKLRAVLPYLRYVLAETKDVVLVVARHKDTIAAAAKALAAWSPLVITGEVAPRRRVALVAAFQADPAARLAVFNYESGGVGLNVQKVDRVVLLEYSWRDGDNAQAIDRAHRIGRAGAVRAQYVVLKGSVDARRMQVLLDKRRDAV